MSTEDPKQEATTDQAEAPDMYEVASRVSAFTQELLADGANASDVAFRGKQASVPNPNADPCIGQRLERSYNA